MKVIFCSMMFADIEKDIQKSKAPNTASGHIFQENILQGIVENGCDISVINIPRIRRYPDYPAIFCKRQQTRWHDKVGMVHVGFINLPVLNMFTQRRAVYRELKKQVESANGEPIVIFTFNSYVQTGKAMLKIRKKYPNIHLCNVIGDLHGSLGVAHTRRGIRGKLITRIENQQDELAKEYDSFVFLTKYMASALGVEDKPCVVMEGLYPAKNTACEQVVPTEEKTVFYAGSLCKEYGIAHLLQAFSLIEDPAYRLYIAGGDGDQDLVKEYAARDPRITFLGFIPPSEVKKYQQRATVVLNPRQPDLEFVKYSFASKTLECLASGTPYIAHKLPCDPEEYAAYIQYARDDSDEALRDKIVEICEMTKEQRDEIGARARQFVYEEKNPGAMCKRIVDLWKSIVEDV